MNRLAAAAALTLASFALAAPAFATQGPGHKVLVCHVPPGNSDNPQLIEVDVASTAYRGHLNHDDDLIEGRDGDAAAIRAACTVTPTVPVTTTTTTGSTPSVTTTATSSPSPSPTSSTPSATESDPTSSTSATAPTTPHGSPSTESERSSTSTTASPRRSVPSSTDAPPELAFTGADFGLLGLGVAGLGVGVALTATSRRMQGGRH